MNLRTLCVHGGIRDDDPTGAVEMPIYQTAMFRHHDIGEGGYDYSRQQNPTREKLEQLVAGLEHGCGAIGFSSGMAAITCLMELFQPGDHILATDDLYGGSIRLFRGVGEKNGLSFDFMDTSDIEKVRKRLRPQTKALFIETPTNPMMQVTDLRAVAALCREKHLLLLVDNTFLTPYLQNPLELGADVVIHSGTKFLAGHNDTLAGFLVAKDPQLLEKLRWYYMTTGACLSPMDSWLVLRGIKTLAVRMERQQQNALALAQWLQKQSWVRKVLYVGLPEHPGYEINCKQSRGAGAMISFVVDSSKTALRLLRNVQLILFAESLGGTETLLTYPMTQTHADLPKEEREARGINDCLLRLSVGLEEVTDLEEDLQQAAAAKDI
ncbi:MAG: PLP-dependent aspartate aminotransferase family protein [Oscillospiraceae bacterium]|nr:PLP-dependent aspartate aminotransferase family protein [Oscillospiraceae bacterium]